MPPSCAAKAFPVLGGVQPWLEKDRQVHCLTPPQKASCRGFVSVSLELSGGGRLQTLVTLTGQQLPAQVNTAFMCVSQMEEQTLTAPQSLVNLLMASSSHLLSVATRPTWANVVRSLPPKRSEKCPLGTQCPGNSWDVCSGK